MGSKINNELRYGEEYDGGKEGAAATGRGFGGSPWNPRNWGWKRWAAAGLALAVLIIIIVVPSVVVTRNNRYPDYSRLTYSLKDTYSGTTFFDNFDYGNGTDKTDGFVNYVTKEGAAFSNLTYASSSSALVKVENTTNTGTAGRPSVKIMSKTNYTKGLFVFDITHTPYGCGTWPAVWVSDEQDWPKNGEIDIIEAVNKGNNGNQMTLHTTDSCEMKVKRKETGKVLDTNCLNSTDGNAGCGVQGNDTSYGEAFNNIGGGVYAMEWRTAGIRIWFFERADIPSDITSGSPDPSTWGTATADFPSTECNIDDHFSNGKIIINIELCGSWAGSTAIYTTEFGCEGTCSNFVGNNPSAFSNAFWEFKSIKVYQSADA